MKLHHRIAAWFGYDLIRRRRNDLTAAAHLRNLLELLRVNCVIDVGANRGQYGRQLRDIGFAGRIASFEPVTRSCELLRREAQGDDQWLVFPYALGARSGSMSIQVATISELSSFRPPSAHLRERFGAGAQVDMAESVAVRRLDDVFGEATAGVADALAFLKLDTQGFDLEVLAGATHCLDRIAGLQTELSLLPLYEGMPDYLTALSTLRALGFEPTGFYPVCRAEPGLGLIEVDCFLQRRRDQSTPRPH